MRLKLPPLFVFFLFFLMMLVLWKFLPVGKFVFFGQWYLVIALLCLSACITLVSLIQFFSSKTTVDPRYPAKSTTLVTNGIYGISRNPMYLAMLLALLAWGLWLGNAFNTLIAAGFVGYMNRFQIIPEEEALTGVFGSKYQQYCGQVRRWF